MDREYETLTELFTAIADSIRLKKGTVDQIIADHFPTEISSIDVTDPNKEHWETIAIGPPTPSTTRRYFPVSTAISSSELTQFYYYTQTLPFKAKRLAFFSFNGASPTTQMFIGYINFDNSEGHTCCVVNNGQAIDTILTTIVTQAVLFLPTEKNYTYRHF